MRLFFRYQECICSLKDTTRCVFACLRGVVVLPVLPIRAQNLSHRTVIGIRVCGVVLCMLVNVLGLFVIVIARVFYPSVQSTVTMFVQMSAICLRVLQFQRLAVVS